jgi:hypothetical protein
MSKKEHRVTTCADYIQKSQNSSYILNCIFTENESWDFQYDFEVWNGGKIITMAQKRVACKN